MSLIIEYAGEDITGDVRLESGIQGLTSAADGQFESATIKIDDEAGTRVITPWQLLTADEDECDLPRIWTGYLFQEDADRGAQPHTGPSRDYVGQMSDLNVLLHMQPARGADAKRPVETGNARMAWLLSSVCLDGLVFDGGLIGDNPNLFDAADYNDPPAFADEILQDLCVSSSDDEPGRIFCVLWDQTDERPVLFMDVPTAAVYDSELSISNDLDDVDPFGPTAEVFYPHPDAALTGQGSDIYCSVFFIYKTGRVFLHDQDTHDEFFGHDSINHRQAVYSTSRVGSLETAERHAAQFLANHNGKKDTITCRIVVPKEQVNKLDVAMRVQVKFTHLRGFETFTWTRVQRRTVLLNSNPARTDQYEMVLELSTKGFAEGTGGPPPSDFPAPPAVGGDVVQSVADNPATDGGGQYLTLPSTPSPGNTLVVFLTGGASTPGLLAGWTDSPVGVVGTSGFYQVTSRMAYRVVASGQAAKVYVNNSNCLWANLWEISGTIDSGTLITDSELHSTLSKPATVTSGSVTTTGPALILSGVNMSQHDWSGTGDQGISDDSSWTHSGKHEIANPGYQTGNDRGDFSGNVSQAAYRKVTAAGTYSPTFALTGGASNFGGWGGLMIAIPALASDNPPGSGQLVPWTQVTLTPSGGVSVGTTASPYAPGSLTVKVDGVLISPASYTETDPNTGDFALSWLLDGDETVIVQYQGL